ncbi:FimV/HubP family polar landmark protein, partial [Pseudomonas sp. EGD-AK9]|uniref:FimV/HubP family polar landmark protein n=1 Tax=Pseudomonas sp. EGD-AK9 TaxID=1386078 RepID=UPI0005648965
PAPSQPPLAPPAAEPLAEPDFQLNLDDLPLDADWDMVSPFEAARGKTKAVAAAEFDAGFSSNLQELPEVFELDEEVQTVSAFGEMEMVVGGEDELLDEHFLDAFAGEADATAALQGDIEQLAGNPEHMAKLNQALAYIEQGNLSSACDILNEVIDQGDDRQKQAARQLLAEIA